MDQESEKKLAEVVANGVGALTEPDIEFLKARRSYLNEEQLAVFKEVLAEPESEEKPKKAKKDE